MSEKSWVFRLAVAEDAPEFSKWAAENPQIAQKDLLQGMKATNPTVVTFVAEHDGKAILFAPVYMMAMLAHLGVNPEARAAEILQAMNVLKDGVSAFLVQYGIRSVGTLSLPDYGVAKWALAHSFEMDKRNLFVLDLNREMAPAEA